MQVSACVALDATLKRAIPRERGVIRDGESRVEGHTSHTPERRLEVACSQTPCAHAGCEGSGVGE